MPECNATARLQLWELCVLWLSRRWDKLKESDTTNVNDHNENLWKSQVIYQKLANRVSGSQSVVVKKCHSLPLLTPLTLNSSNMNLASAVIRTAVAWKRWLYREYVRARDNKEYLICLFIQPPCNLCVDREKCRCQIQPYRDWGRWRINFWEAVLLVVPFLGSPILKNKEPFLPVIILLLTYFHLEKNNNITLPRCFSVFLMVLDCTRLFSSGTIPESPVQFASHRITWLWK